MGDDHTHGWIFVDFGTALDVWIEREEPDLDTEHHVLTALDALQHVDPGIWLAKRTRTEHRGVYVGAAHLGTSGRSLAFHEDRDQKVITALAIGDSI